MGEGTFAGTRGNDENAPVPVIAYWPDAILICDLG
jgi:hypothetical protein